ncbi:MAG: SUMF1/EgtB/PvdO family nonheme iron enzyme [Pirellulales bacterium]
MVRRWGLVGICAVGINLLGLCVPCFAQQKPASTAKPSETRNTLEMTFVQIPAGEFEMGNPLPAEELIKKFPGYNDFAPKHLIDEEPKHKVRITKPFLLSKYETTRAQFQAFVDATGYKTQPEADGTGAGASITTKRSSTKSAIRSSTGATRAIRKNLIIRWST